MATIADAVNKNRQRITQGGETGTDAHLVESSFETAPTPPMDLPTMLPQRGMFPANLVLASDRSDSSRTFRGLGVRSATFPYPQNPNPVSQKTTIVTQQISSSSAAPSTVLSLLTNNIPNASQKELNLIAGAGVTLTSDSSGGVTIDSSVIPDKAIYVVSWIPGKPGTGQLACIFTVAAAMTFPANFASPNSYGSLSTNPTSSAVYTVNQNGSGVGTITISTGGVFTFATSGGTSISLAAGDRLTIVAPNPQDTTLADVGITLAGTRS